MTEKLQNIINQAFDNRSNISPSTVDTDVKEAIETAIDMLDRGQARVAEKVDGEWVVNQWLKKAVLLSFAIRDNELIDGGDTRYFDKVESKFADYDEARFKSEGFRVVPSMVDTWATVGSCAQIGKNVHLSGGVGIGGVLEPIQAGPVIIEDNCFIGARSEIVEGVIVEEGSVISMGVYIGQSTKILDRETGEVSYGRIPAGSVVVSGSMPSKDGSHSLYCAVIVKKVDAKTRSKTGLNELLRVD